MKKKKKERKKKSWEQVFVRLKGTDFEKILKWP